MARGKARSSSETSPVPSDPKPKVEDKAKGQSQSEDEGSYSEYTQLENEESEGEEDYSDYSDNEGADDEEKKTKADSPKGGGSKKSCSPPARKVMVVDTPSPERKAKDRAASKTLKKLESPRTSAQVTLPGDLKPQAKQAARQGDKNHDRRYGYGHGDKQDRERGGDKKDDQRRGHRRSRSRSWGKGDRQHDKQGAKHRRDSRDRGSKNGNVELEELRPPPRRDDGRRRSQGVAEPDDEACRRLAAPIIRKLIEDIYYKCKKSMQRKDVDAVLKKYDSVEWELYNVLCQTYDEEPQYSSIEAKLETIGGHTMPPPRATTIRGKDGRMTPVIWGSSRSSAGSGKNRPTRVRTPSL